MQFAELKPESCELHIMWEKTMVTISYYCQYKR